jgi:cell division protein FtsQ
MAARRGARPRRAPWSVAQALRRAGRALGFGLLAVLVLLLAGGAWVFGQQLLSPEHHPVQAVEVEGAVRHVRESDLYAALGPLLVHGFWGVPVHRAREAVEALEWVESARVRRVWPDRLVVSVQEHQALARWGGDGLVTRRGQVFRPTPDTWPSGLALLEGESTQPTLVVERYLAWRALLDDLGDAPLHIQVDARQSWRVLLASGAVLELGRVDVDQRMRRFVDTANLILRATDQRIMTADLRYPNGLAIRWRGNDGN